MRIFLAALLLAISWGLRPQSAEKNQQNLQTYSDPDAYEVYAALLPSKSVRNDLRTKYLVILQETGSTDSPDPQACLPRRKQVREIWASVLEDYKKQNQTPRLLFGSFSIGRPYKFISRTELSDFFANTTKKSLRDMWQGFYSRYPNSGGYTELSAVGFNADKTKAFVYSAVHCGSLCGMGSYTFLEKRDGKIGRAHV